MSETEQNVEPPREAPLRLTMEASIMAFFSAAVFGALGALAGRFLGSKGGERGERLLGKKFWTWTAGVASALVAAYTSLKTSAAEEELKQAKKDIKEAQSAPVAPAAPEKDESPRAKSGDEVAPEHVVALEEAAHFGALAREKTAALQQN